MSVTLDLLFVVLAAVLIFAACTEEPTQNDAQPPVDGKQNTQDDVPVTPASITLPDGLKEIHDGVFNGCGSLTSIVIPDSVIYIDSAFYLCTELKTIYYTGTKTEWSNLEKHSNYGLWYTAKIIYNYKE